MKLLPLLLATVALAAAAPSSSEEYRSDDSWFMKELKSSELSVMDRHFKTDREYTFFYNGQLTTGIPSSSRMTAGTRIQSLVTLVFKSDERVLMKLSRTRFGKLNDEIPRADKQIPFEAFEEVEIEQDLHEKLQKPVEFKIRHGLIKDIKFERHEQSWSANIKRGILNLLQLDTNKDSRVDYLNKRSMEKSSSEENMFSFEKIESSDSESKEERSSEELFKKSLKKSFKVIEKTLEGECETLYTVVPASCADSESVKDCRTENVRIFKVVKSINFDKCTKRPEVRYNERFQEPCTRTECDKELFNKEKKSCTTPECERERENRKERSLRSTSVITMTVVCPTESSSVKKCLIEKSDSESEYNFVMFAEESNAITTFVRQSLRLVKSSSIETEVRELVEPIDSDSHMIYSLDWDVMKEQFFMDGEDEFQTRTPFSKVEDKYNFIKTVIEKLMHYTREHVQEEAPRQLARLVRLLRMLKIDELKTVHEKFFVGRAEKLSKEEHEKVKELLIDSMGLCGTHDCLTHVLETIEKDQVSTTRASMTIRKFMESRVVNQRMITKLVKWCSEESRKCERSPQIKQAVYLTTGAMINSFCNVKKFDLLAISSKSKIVDEKLDERCTKEMREKFVEEFMEKFRSTDSEYNKILVLKSLRNAGLKESIKPLVEIVYDKRVSPVIRNEAILSMSQLTKTSSEKIVNYLLPIFVSRRESPEVRITAVYQILETVPDKLVIDQIVRVLKSERNMQVASFIYTLLQTKSESKQPCLKKLTKDIKLSIRHISKLSVERWMSSSKFHNVFTQKSNKHDTFVSMDYVNIKSGRTLPRKMATSLNLNIANMWSPRFVTIETSQIGLNKVLNQIWRSYSHNLQSPLSELLSGQFQRPSSKFNYRSELKQIFEKLNVEVEDESPFKPYGQFEIKFKNMDYAFLPVSEDIIREQIREILPEMNFNDLSEFVKSSKNMLKDRSITFKTHTATFVHEQSRKIPTSMGVPIRMSYKVPTVMQVSGSIKIDIDETEPFRKFKIIVKDLKPSIVSTAVGKLESWSPIVNSGVKVVAQVKVFTPLEAEIALDTIKTPTEFKMIVKPLISSSSVELLNVVSRPSTFVQIWPRFLKTWKEPEEKTMHSYINKRVHKHDVSLGENSLGLTFRSRAQWHRIPKSSFSQTPISLLSGQNRYSLTMNSGFDMPKEFVLTVTGKVSQDENDKAKVSVKGVRDSKFLLNDNTEIKSSEEVKSPIVTELQVKLNTRGSSVSRKAEVDTKCYFDSKSRAHKCIFEILRTPIPNEESEDWKLKSEFDIILPTTPLTFDQLTNNKAIISSLKSKWGMSSNMDKSVELSMLAKQSDKIQSLKENSLYKRQYNDEVTRKTYRSLFSPVSQYKQLMKYSLIDEIKFDLDYKLADDQEDRLYNLLDMIKSKYYDQTYTSSKTRKSVPENSMVAKVTIDPITRNYVNVSIMTPYEQTKMVDLPMWFRVPKFMHMRHISKRSSRSAYDLFVSLFESSDKRVCERRTDRVATFDELEMAVPSSTCWSLLTKDCKSSDESKFAVLMKKLSPESEQKELKIITRSVKLNIRPKSDESLECKLNDVERPCEELTKHLIHKDHKALICDSTDNLIECELPESGIKIIFDGYSCDIETSSFYRDQLCGLCGDKDSDMYNDKLPSWSSSRSSEESSSSMERIERSAEKSLELSSELRDSSNEQTYVRRLLSKFLVKDSEDEQCEHAFSDRRQTEWDALSSSEERESRELVSSERSSSEEIEELRENPIRERYSKVRPIEKTRVIEQAHELCFSTQPVKTCPRSTHPSKFEDVKRKISFACLSRNSYEAERLMNRVLRTGKLDSLDAEKSFNEEVRVPIECRHYY